MGTTYKAVTWNRQKKLYDRYLVAGVGLFLVAFVVVTLRSHPGGSLEIALIRAFGAAAVVLLHLVLCSGPLARLSPKFLPVVYNRRHMGVTTFLLGLVHAVLVIVTYHAGGDINPFLSIFADGSLGDPGRFAFQAFGFIALVTLFLMAATSHDFWLANLSAPVWKRLHMLVYLAYFALVVHVAFGALQTERSPVYVFLTGLGVVVVVGLHLAAGFRGRSIDRVPKNEPDQWVPACQVADIPENRALVASISDERVAIFRYAGKVSAVSNVCQHQNGPLGEGQIVDGCITCPWHGYQYRPDTGESPPPFTESVPTFNVQVINGTVFIHAKPNPPGERAEPAPCEC